LCRITPAGLKRFQAYLQELEKVVRDAAAARDAAAQAKEGASSRDKTWAEGWVPA
jgi:hypothetical protein